MYIYIYFCYDNSQRDWHCNVHENVNVFGLGGIDLVLLLRQSKYILSTANTFTPCCCEHVENTAAAHTTHMNYPLNMHESSRSRSIQV